MAILMRDTPYTPFNEVRKQVCEYEIKNSNKEILVGYLQAAAVCSLDATFMFVFSQFINDFMVTFANIFVVILLGVLIILNTALAANIIAKLITNYKVRKFYRRRLEKIFVEEL